MGKSTVTLDIAARVTSGLPWPDDADAVPEPGDVLLLSAEDDPADTVRPRVDAADGTPSRIHVLKAVAEKDQKTGKSTERMFSLARDVPRLERMLEQNGSIRLVVIDPLSAYLGGAVDSYRDSDVRAQRLVSKRGERRERAEKADADQESRVGRHRGGLQTAHDDA